MNEPKEKYNIITEGSLHKAMWKLALPAMLSMISFIFFELADAYWISDLGTQTVAGFGGASFCIWMIASFIGVLSVGTVTLVAQSKGAKDEQAVAHWSLMSVKFSLLLSLLLLLAGFLLIPKILDFMKLSESAKLQALLYTRVYLIGIPFITLLDSGDAIFRGSGDTLRPMSVMVIGIIINAVLDPLLIRGIWIFPKLGIKGAAWASTIAVFLASAMMFALLLKHKYRFKLSNALSHNYLKFVKIGLPIAALGAGFSLIYVFLTRIITMFGDAPLAAVTIGHRIESIPYFVAMGLATAVATLVGQNVGARKFERAKQAVSLAILYCNWILVVFSIFFFFGAEQIYSMFLASDAVVLEGVHYLMIIAIFEMFLGWEVIYSQAFAGAGNSTPAFVISLPLSSLRIPLAYFLAFNFELGADGIWWAISFTTFLKGIILAFWFSLGHWQKKALQLSKQVSVKALEVAPLHNIADKPLPIDP